MEFVEASYEFKRLCDYYAHDCPKCPLSKVNNGQQKTCETLKRVQPSIAEDILKNGLKTTHIYQTLTSSSKFLVKKFLNTLVVC